MEAIPLDKGIETPPSSGSAGPRQPAPRRRHPWRAPLLRLLTAIAPIIISGALRVLALTVRVRYVAADELIARWEGGEQSIVAFWHGRAVMMPIANRSPNLCIMNSQRRDGEIATRALARWGIRAVRGSATRGGIGGFLLLVRAYRDGASLAVVPDGPRGPRCVAKAGVIHLARATGAAIFPVSYAATRQFQLHSWDQLVIPLPFARVTFVGGEPLHVPRHATDAEIEALRCELETRLNRASETADALSGQA